MSTIRAKLIRLNYYKGSLCPAGEKTYYTPEESAPLNQIIESLMINNNLSYFEYSENNSGEIETYNFHVDLLRDNNNGLYEIIQPKDYELLKSIPNLLDESFKNYTIGYRVNSKSQIIGVSYYYYPTRIKDGGRIGMNSITNNDISIKYANILANHLFYLKSSHHCEMKKFMLMSHKFMGVSVSFYKDKKEFKLYIRCPSTKVEDFLSSKIDFNINESFSLIAMRINNGNISGYNLYFV